MSIEPMGRKEAASFLQSTLSSLVPRHVIDRVWDRVVAPLYDAGTRQDTPGQTVSSVLDTSGHSVRCGECYPGDGPCASCQDLLSGQQP